MTTKCCIYVMLPRIGKTRSSLEKAERVDPSAVSYQHDIRTASVAHNT